MVIRVKNKNAAAGRRFIVFGIVLLAFAALMSGYNMYDDYRAGQESGHVLTVLEERTAAYTGAGGTFSETAQADAEDIPDYVLNPEKEMPSEEIDGRYYIGVIEIPVLGLALPVMSSCSDENLKTAPCRYSGSAYNGNFTIAGHSHITHFRSIRSLAGGEQVIFTDTQGNIFYYEVCGLETLEPDDVEEMISGEWDLTLFTCTSSTQARVAVRCIKTKI
jgi:sortase A